MSTVLAPRGPVGLDARKILVVDDDPSIRTLIRLVAERRGLGVDVAADGLEALELLGRKQYDLAIIDLMMPRVNGYELVDRMRSFTQRPAVIIATAMTESLIDLVDPLVVHSIIRKPFDIEILGAMMTALVTATEPVGEESPSPQQDLPGLPLRVSEE